MWPLEKEHPDIGDIVRLVRNWGPEMDNEVKVPSVISYSPRTAKKELQFGANLSPDAVTMLSTKLELDVQDTRLEELDLIIQVLDGMRDLNFQHIKNSKSMPEYTWKTPEDIVTDYLKKVFQPFWEATDYWNTHRAKAQVDIVITIPVVSLDLSSTVRF